jgi:hypothetical protein
MYWARGCIGRRNRIGEVRCRGIILGTEVRRKRDVISMARLDTIMYWSQYAYVSPSRTGSRESCGRPNSG